MPKKEKAGQKPEIREIGSPKNITHGYHVEFDPVTTRFTGVPAPLTHMLPEGLARPRDDAHAQRIPAHLEPASDVSAGGRQQSDALSPNAKVAAAQPGIIGKPFNVRRVSEGSEVRTYANSRPHTLCRAMRNAADGPTCGMQTSTRPDIPLPRAASLADLLRGGAREPLRYLSAPLGALPSGCAFAGGSRWA